MMFIKKVKVIFPSIVFSGYVTYMLEEMMQKDKTFARYAPKIEKISVDDDRVVLKDNMKK